MTLRAFVTGGTGFVGRYLCDSLTEKGSQVFVYAATPAEYSCPGVTYALGNLRDEPLLSRSLNEFAPDHVFHLAALSSVGGSWQDPYATFEQNVGGTFTLLQCCDRLRQRPRVLNVSTGAVYAPSESPITELSAISPQNPYAASKAMAELNRFMFPELDVITVRPFNHSGPGQSPIFFLPDITRQVAEVKRGIRRKVTAGDLTVERDFTHVADVVRAYCLLIERGHRGEIYNVCSGASQRLSEIVDRLYQIAGTNAPIEVDQLRVRTGDPHRITGSFEKMRLETGWQPRISFDRLLHDLFEYWLNKTEASISATEPNAYRSVKCQTN